MDHDVNLTATAFAGRNYNDIIFIMKHIGTVTLETLGILKEWVLSLLFLESL